MASECLAYRRSPYDPLALTRRVVANRSEGFVTWLMSPGTSSVVSVARGKSRMICRANSRCSAIATDFRIRPYCNQYPSSERELDASSGRERLTDVEVSWLYIGAAWKILGLPMGQLLREQWRSVGAEAKGPSREPHGRPIPLSGGLPTPITIRKTLTASS